MKVFIGLGEFRQPAFGMFRDRGFEILDSKNRKEADLICFMGGADVNPELYGEKNVKSYVDPSRDTYDRSLFDEFINIPKVGICRGGQILNVFSGGSMWQDTNNHGGTHDVLDKESGKVIKVSSTHHQMMRPSLDAVILATCERSDYVEGFKTKRFRIEDKYSDIEVVFYPETKSLCFQPHPEIGPDSCEEYFFSLIEKHLGV